MTRKVFSGTVLTLGLALAGCLIDRRELSPPVAADEDAPVDARRALDTAVEVDAWSEADSARADAFVAIDAWREPDAGSDAGPCPDGATGSATCPFTTLAQLLDVASGTYSFAMGGRTFQALVEENELGGWMLIASANHETTGRVSLVRSMTGPVTRQSHTIFAPEVVAVLPDAREVRIDSSPGSNVIASVQSNDAYVLGQFRGYLSLHASVDLGEAGTVRWRGDADRMRSTCRNTAPESLDRLIFQTCGARGDNLHWGPNPTRLGDSPDSLNRWVYDTGPRDRLNLWVRG